MHHTKDKGDKGVGFVIADLLAKGEQVALPLSEHLPFDLVAIVNSGKNLFRVSVKYREQKNGRIEVALKSSWADRHGTHRKTHSKKEYDWIAIYCPSTQKCYYIKVSDIAGSCITLRLEPTKNNQIKKILFAEEYNKLPEL